MILSSATLTPSGICTSPADLLYTGPMLETKGLKIRYPKGREINFPDLNILSADRLLIHGPSGCGKTSLINLICGLLTPTSGSVRMLGRDYASMSSSERDHFRGRHIGICLQRPVFIRALSALENLILVQKLAGQHPDAGHCMTRLKSLSLEHTAHRKPHTLSPGEQQRLMFLRALIHRPKLVVADEPSSSLDDANADAVMDLLISQCGEYEMTLLVVSHDARIKSRFNHQILLS